MLMVHVAAPIIEEFIFRGFLFTGLEKSRVGGLGAVLITAACWSVLHIQYDAYEIATIFVMGVGLGFARLKTRSLYLSILLHALNNAIATIGVVIAAGHRT